MSSSHVIGMVKADPFSQLIDKIKMSECFERLPKKKKNCSLRIFQKQLTANLFFDYTYNTQNPFWHKNSVSKWSSSIASTFATWNYSNYLTFSKQQFKTFLPEGILFFSPPLFLNNLPKLIFVFFFFFCLHPQMGFPFQLRKFSYYF